MQSTWLECSCSEYGGANSVLKVYLRAQLCDIQGQEVKSGVFECRTKEFHQLHVKTAREKGTEYKMAATLRIILGVDNASKLTLPTVIPDSVEDLKGEIRRNFGLSGNFRLQYRDIEFDNEFVNLTVTSEMKDKTIVKVIYLPNESATTVPHTALQGFDDSSLLSSSSDTDILSSNESTSSGSSFRSQPWPPNFHIPQFSYEVQIQLEKANQAFYNSGTLLNPRTKLKSDILDGLASEIVKYKVYPSNAEFNDVAEALIIKYPCLKEQGSVTGYYGWKISLKYKMANYHTKLRNIGCPELSINAVKEKRGAMSQGPNQVKKPQRAEVSYPDYPTGETKESLEKERQALMLEVKKRNNQQLIQSKMERTFAFVFESQVNAEFTRITTVPLLSTFMSNLDHYSSQLVRVFKKKGGTAGHDISLIMATMDKNRSVEVRQECILKALCVYLNEKPDSFMKEYLDVNLDTMREMEKIVLGIYIL